MNLAQRSLISKTKKARLRDNKFDEYNKPAQRMLGWLRSRFRTTCCEKKKNQSASQHPHNAFEAASFENEWETHVLRDMDEKGRMRELLDLDYRDEFDAKWAEFAPVEQQAMNDEIQRKLDELVASPNPRWGAIMNTSIEGGQVNPHNGKPGDWSGTPWHPIWVRHGYSDHQAGLFFGNLWKLRIIERPEQWVGIRNSADRPTFPQKGITLQGKTYFVSR